ncbi:MAG TPA: CerR family C-terminal domain-containing protein [Terriglobia bacterium]|nr:CerR family C-terminal domain-containing protein [Terriglobia bacterium]
MHADSSTNDHETRQRLLAVAARLFAERGFKNVTIREICTEAGANVAAVNYHFRDKMGLYETILNSTIDGSLRRREEAAKGVKAGESPEERLRAYIRVYMRSILGEQDQQQALFGKLMSREWADPTPAFRIIFERALQPNWMALSAIVKENLGVAAGDHPAEGCGGDRRVDACTMSILGQCIIYASGKQMSEYFAPGKQFNEEIIDSIAAHITEFSLAGMRAIAELHREVKP